MVDANTLEVTLKTQQWVGGQSPTTADVETFEALKSESLNAGTHPHVFAWFCLVSKFTDVVRKTWPAGAGAKADKKGGKADKKETKKEDKLEDEDLNLFGEENKEDLAAAAEDLAAAKAVAEA